MFLLIRLTVWTLIRDPEANNDGYRGFCNESVKSKATSQREDYYSQCNNLTEYRPILCYLSLWRFCKTFTLLKFNAENTSIECDLCHSDSCCCSIILPYVDLIIDISQQFKKLTLTESTCQLLTLELIYMWNSLPQCSQSEVEKMLSVCSAVSAFLYYWVLY